MKELTEADPVHHRRVGYPGTGYAFHFMRCLNHKALRDCVKKIPGVLREPWFSGSGDKIPDGFTACRPVSVLKGIVPEAAGSFLCEIYIVAVAVPGTGREALREELRRWRHEIGHAVAFGAAELPDVLAGVRSRAASVCLLEFPAFCNEFLCEAADAMLSGDEFAAASGFRSIFPWAQPWAQPEAAK